MTTEINPATAYNQPIVDTADTEGQLNLLAAFLLEQYPDQIGGGDLHYGEGAVEVAIRLLDDPRVVGVLKGTLRAWPLPAAEEIHDG